MMSSWRVRSAGLAAAGQAQPGLHPRGVHPRLPTQPQREPEGRSRRSRPDVADVRAFLKNPKGPFPATDQASSAVISPNVQYLWNYSVPKGRYVLLCFWPDLKTGSTHAEKGMIRAVTVR